MYIIALNEKAIGQKWNDTSYRDQVNSNLTHDSTLMPAITFFVKKISKPSFIQQTNYIINPTSQNKIPPLEYKPRRQGSGLRCKDSAPSTSRDDVNNVQNKDHM